MIQQSEKHIPEIVMEEDSPFLSGQSVPSMSGGDRLNQTSNIEEKITIFRYETGKKVLFVSMAAMGIAVAADLISTKWLCIESELVNNAFEAFKLITMTVLGYIFGSNNSSK